MAEPNATAAAAAVPLIIVFTDLFGQTFGAYVMIAFGAVCGCFWALANTDQMTRWQVVKMSIRVISLSVFMTVAVSELLSHAFGWEVSELYIVVSIAIAAMGDKWLSVIESLSEAIKTAVAGIFKAKDKSQ